jgi:putative adhesin
MKKIILVVLLVAIAGVAGIVRSHSKTGTVSEWRHVIHGDKQSTGDVREEIRKSYGLSPGARIEVSGINGAVKIETSDSKTADVYIERTGDSQEVLNRRKVTIDNTSGGLTIRGEKSDGSFFARIFGSQPSERVTLRLPRQVSLVTKGVNGSVVVGEIEGPVEVKGINGRVDIAQASGSAEFKGINGNISCGLKQIDKGGVDISGINGNIELRLNDSVNASLDAHGMNGNVTSDLPNVVVDKSKHGSYSAQIGSGGNSISASGINGNIRLTRMMTASTSADQEKSGS